MKNRKNVWLLLLGTFSLTQLRFIGSIGISELVVFIIAPFVFFQDLPLLRRHGFLPFLTFAMAVCCACVVSCWVNHTVFFNGLRGFAQCYSLFAIPVVVHRLLNGNLMGVRYFLIGAAITVILNTFFFQRGAEAVMYAGGEQGVAAAVGIMSSPIFWIGRIKPWAVLPITGWYLKVPTLYSVVVPIAFVAFAMISSASGRSAALVTLAGCALILIGGKSIKNMRRVSKCFWGIFLVGILGLVLFKEIYVYGAREGLLGEEAQVKYEQQTRGKSDMLSIIMGGRGEFFIGVFAAIRRPWMGYGPWAVDEEGICADYLQKYGTAEDIENYQKYIVAAAQQGVQVIKRWIPAHSHIVYAWVSYGIVGLLFWIYVLMKICLLAKNNLSCIPAWFGYFAITTPSMIWAIMFSPFGDRVAVSFYLTCVFIVDAVRRGKIPLTEDVMSDDQKRLMWRNL